MYNTLIFDFDDTLTDDTENVKQAFKIMLEYKKENYTDEKFFRFRNIDLQTWKDRNDGKLISPYENNRVTLIYLSIYNFSILLFRGTNGPFVAITIFQINLLGLLEVII